MDAHIDDNDDDIEGGDITGASTENSQDDEQLSDDFICDDQSDLDAVPFLSALFGTSHFSDDESQKTELDYEQENFMLNMPSNSVDNHSISEDNSEFDMVPSIPTRRSVIASDTEDDSNSITRVSPRKRAISCISTDSDNEDIRREENDSDLSSTIKDINAVSGYMDIEAQEGLHS
jgi:hypothetical protein